MCDAYVLIVNMTASVNLTGYGPRRTLVFDGDESKYELWEVKFLGYMRLQKLYDVVIPKEGETSGPNAEKIKGQVRSLKWSSVWTAEAFL